MTTEVLLRRFLGGHLLFVGEFRGGRADQQRFVDKKSGLASSRVIITYVVECAIGGAFNLMKICQRAPEAVTEAEQVAITLQRGRRYIFELEAFKNERGCPIAWISREPALLATSDEPEPDGSAREGRLAGS
jgi:hypothetical protein